MIDAPFAFAFAAGLVATLNPCGFAMLPAYLSYFMGVDNDAEYTAGVGRGLLIGGVVSSGFLLVFGLAGVLITLGIRSIIDFIPWIAAVIGALLVVLGVAMLFFGVELNVRFPHLDRGGADRSRRQVFLFGISYAIASLSCALPVFLTVTAVATTTSNFLSGLLTFLTYGAGMSMLLLVITVAMGVAKGGLARKLKRVLPYVSRVSGAILIVAGTYITVFWIVNIRDPLAARGATFRSVEGVQTWFSQQLGSRPGFWAAALGGILLLSALWAWRTRRVARKRRFPKESEAVWAGPDEVERQPEEV